MREMSGWTRPHHGVRHHGVYGTKTRWATVEDRDSFTTLLCWFPGCGFNPATHDYDTIAEAMVAGEAFVRTGLTP